MLRGEEVFFRVIFFQMFAAVVFFVPRVRINEKENDSQQGFFFNE